MARAIRGLHALPQGNISRRRHIAYGVYIANSQNLYRRVRSRWFLCCRETARRVEGLAAARSFGGSDDAPCRHSLPPQSPRPTTAAVYFYGNKNGRSKPLPYGVVIYFLSKFLRNDTQVVPCGCRKALYQSLRHPSDATSLYTKEATVAVNLYIFDFRFSFCILHFAFSIYSSLQSP